VQIGRPSASTYSYTGPAVAIPDYNSTGINVPININGFTGNIDDLNFRFDGNACTSAAGATTVGLDHTWVGDLVITLTSPQGTTVTLLNRPGGGSFGSAGNNFCNTVLDDEGGVASIQSITEGSAPSTGAFTPASPLAAFKGQNPNGTWTLHVSDMERGDTGNVRAFSLAVAGAPSCADDASPKTVATRVTMPNDAGWNNTDADIALNAVDNKAGSGVRDITYSAVGAQSIPTTTVAGGSTTLTINAQGTTTINFHARDNAGNVEVVQSLTVRVDKAPPTITITAPVNTLYALNQAVTAGYSCGDSVSGLVACTGNVPAGENIDTSTTGTHNFTVTATDVAGNSSTTTVNYRVANSNPTYNVRLLYDPTKSHKIGSTIPIKIQLLNSLTGVNASSSALVAHAIGVVKESEYAPGPVEDAGNANPDDNFRFNNFEGTGSYIFNLKTTGLTNGTYILVFQAGNDPFTYGVKFQVN